MPTLQQRIAGNQALQRVYGAMSAADVRRIETALRPLALHDMEAVLFRLAPDWTAGPATGVAAAVLTTIENYCTGAAVLLTPLQFKTVVQQHGTLLGPGAVDLRTRLDTLRPLLLQGAGAMTGPQFVAFPGFFTGATGTQLLDVITWLRSGGGTTATAIYDVVANMGTTAGTIPAMTGPHIVEVMRRLHNNLNGARMIATITNLGGPVCEWIRGAFAIQMLEELAWGDLGDALEPNGWTNRDIHDTLRALHALGANTLPRLTALIRTLTAADAAGANRMAAAQVQELAAAVNDYAQLTWIAAGIDGATRFPHIYAALRAAGVTAAGIAGVIAEAYAQRASLSANQCTELLNIARQRNATMALTRRFIQWVVRARNDNAAITWQSSIARINNFASDHVAGIWPVPAEITQHVGMNRLKVTQDNLRHYVYGHTYGLNEFSRVNLRRAENDHLSFWPAGTTAAQVAAEAGTYIAKPAVQALMNGLAINGSASATIESRRITVQRVANHQYQMKQFFPTAGAGVERIHWAVVAGVGMFLGYMASEAPWAVL